MPRTRHALRSRVPLQLAILLLAAPLGRAVEEGEIDFGRDVRPILSDRCYACHGPDEHSREAELRLDQRDSALGANERGAAIVPGKPGLSELVARISTEDPDDLMPPPEHKKPLTSKQKEILIRWIAEGAEYEPHWAFLAPLREPLPDVENPDWAQNAIDHFVLARLERLGLAPSAAAGRETLIRRVTLDLSGLPATPEEVDAFVRDSRSDAYERVVDDLMKTTVYAERRAQDWLDLARYADTRGFADDKPRAIWPYRDWVIRALDRNMPFDQFTIEQLAGDMLRGATDEQRLATGFHRNAPQARGMTYPVEEYRLKGVADRVNTVGRVWLGVTLDCAECHDHKFDPIRQRDYYSMFALFNNIEHSGQGHGQGGPTMDYQAPASEQGQEALEGELSRMQAELAAAREALPEPGQIADRQLIGKWDGPAIEAEAERFSLKGDLTITANIRTAQPVVNIVSKYDWRGKQRSYVFGIGGEGDKGSLPGHLFFWVSSRADVFAGVTIYGSQAVNDGRDHHVAVEFVAGKSVRLFVDGVEDNAGRISGKPPASIAKSDRPLAIGAGYNGGAEANAFRFEGGLRDVRLSNHALGDQISLGPAGEKVGNLQAAIRKLKNRKAGETVIKSVPVMRERAEARETFIHVRGNFLDRGDRVSPAVPELFDVPQMDQPRDRLEFARWLVGGENPLVARVVVNRFWQSYFGHGLVRTPDDYGAQGTPATHPELLDWLAVEFVDSGWDMKRIHRLIVTSATYRQSARIAPEMQELDPENLLLARMPRVRLPAEQIRDQALAVGGLLVKRVGGPPVFPPQPDGYWQRRVLPGEWQDSEGDDRHRRTIYTYWRRMALHPSLEVLNAPARENCVVRRDVANVPTQALVLLNDPIFVEAAEALAARLIREIDGPDTGRLERGFRLVLGRGPHPDERDRFLKFLARQRERPAAVGELAEWSLVCSVLLNLDETITRP